MALSTSMNYSMYLMMDHNKQQYIEFLKVIKRLKLHYICCKWRRIVDAQLVELKLRKLLSRKQNTLDTHGISLDDQRINKWNELSAPTVTTDPCPD